MKHLTPSGLIWRLLKLAEQERLADGSNDPTKLRMSARSLLGGLDD